ncbi:hypothetical protein [Hymenobacter cavernae]|uniref:YtxH domain-containing protein n=1 Tax=Hymenobacter cavernae TaxID=2044852 RepID=A0ABQ1UM05_9BACT|nr:hypothetical protein [Hymenobacter cavernae]GGF22291.1 hypothetical protein GCM10011383_37410 [Hymenobacter cavernae]
MSTQSQTSEWVKWGIGIAILLGGGALGSAIRYENRITTIENSQATLRSDLDKHIADAKEVKAEMNRRLTSAEDGNKQVLDKLSDLKEDVGAIRGALSIPKASHR